MATLTDSDVAMGIVAGIGFILTGAAACWTLDRLHDITNKRHLHRDITGRWPRKEQP